MRWNKEHVLSRVGSILWRILLLWRLGDVWGIHQATPELCHQLTLTKWESHLVRVRQTKLSECALGVVHSMACQSLHPASELSFHLNLTQCEFHPARLRQTERRQPRPHHSRIVRRWLQKRWFGHFPRNLSWLQRLSGHPRVFPSGQVHPDDGYEQISIRKFQGMWLTYLRSA